MLQAQVTVSKYYISQVLTLKEAGESGSSSVFVIAAVVTLSLAHEAVHVAFTSSITELLTLLCLLVVSPS